MHRSSIVKFQRQILSQYPRTQMMNRAIKPYDVFINHRSIDTKRNVVALLYDHLSRLNIRPFLDKKNMKPALIMESKKKVIPVFCDIKPSQLHITNKGLCSAEEIQRFNWALEEAKYTVGLTFDSLKGNWSEVVTSASDIVINSLIEMENDKQMQSRKFSMPA
ncbi:hypothetical protein GH714_009554 [Hevea brasiliensis]|uniref:TIR domain-containing protein n=1 Tax=Hevea brasiliensis TaxID=3981 RepID=A0A6A6KCZ7_HEVBR|nr:hypothetical protein GH714_009554 [Hevea brasiliensis]